VEIEAVVSDMPLTAVTTLAERKAAEASRREAAADQVVRELQTYARKHGGRIVVFGSYAARRMRFDSDLDVLLDFPPDRTADAWRYAEDLAERHSLPVDIHDAGTSKREFVERVIATGRVLP
jgi:predicted nucleotidyltransferase